MYSPKQKTVYVRISIRNNYQTHITNIKDIAKTLNRSPRQILKWLSIKMRSKCSIETMTIMGVFKRYKLQKALQDYIKLYVVCGHCATFNTIFKVKRKNVRLICQNEDCGLATKVIDDSKFGKI